MLIAAPFPACDRHKLTPNFSWWRSLRIHPAAVTKWEQLICRGFSLLPHRHTAQSVCSCFSPMQENSKNPTPTSISISLRGISLLLHSAGPSWAGVQEVPFNCFTCLLQSWPRETEIKYFALRALSISLLICFLAAQYHCKFTRVRSPEGMDQQPYIPHATCRAV